MFQPIHAVQLHLSLDEIEPLVWRRIVVPSSWTLGQLHLGIQAAFGWLNYHLYEFSIGGLRFGDSAYLMEDTSDDSPRVFEDSDVYLGDFMAGAVFTYVYDFGDNWRHRVEIERFIGEEKPLKQAVCLEGAGACPPEDVGGVSGYERFLDILADRSDPEYAETKRWCGGHFDAEWFDLSITDKDVRNALRTNARRRLHQPRPKAKKADA